MSSHKDITKIGIAGVGHLGAIHARIFSAMKNVSLVGLYDPDAQRVAAVARDARTQVFERYEDMVSEADAVSIVSPTSFHADMALLALKAGKDVFIEKPITTTVQEADAIIAMAKTTQRIVQVGHVERFNAVVMAVQPHIHNPRFIQVDRLGPFSFRSVDIGVVRDLMIHDIDILLHLVNSPIARIDAIGVAVLSDVEDLANARIVFENGCVANINASRASLKPVRTIRIFQDTGYLSIDYRKQKAQMYQKKPGSLADKPNFLDLIRKTSLKVKKNQPLEDELKSFISSVQQRHEPVVTAEHGRRALEVAMEIRCRIQQSL